MSQTSRARATRRGRGSRLRCWTDRPYMAARGVVSSRRVMWTSTRGRPTVTVPVAISGRTRWPRCSVERRRWRRGGDGGAGDGGRRWRRARPRRRASALGTLGAGPRCRPRPSSPWWWRAACTRRRRPGAPASGRSRSSWSNSNRNCTAARTSGRTGRTCQGRRTRPPCTCWSASYGSDGGGDVGVRRRWPTPVVPAEKTIRRVVIIIIIITHCILYSL